jgi:hypothetical protein
MRARGMSRAHGPAASMTNTGPEPGRRACLAWVGGVALTGVAAASGCADRGPATEDVDEVSSASGADASARDASVSRDAARPVEELDAAGSPGDASIDSGDAATDGGRVVTLYDTYAVALYFDGTLGPKTGVVTAAQMAAGVDAPFAFWHGHGGVQHRFTVSAADFAELRERRKATVRTSVVDGHSHLLFIDPTDARWRVPGAQPLTVTI